MKLRALLSTSCLVLSGLLAIPLTGLSQEDTSRVEPRIDLSYFQDDGGMPHLTTRVRVKKDRGWEPLKWVIVNLFLEEETRLGMMGNVTTDLKGSGNYTLPEKFKEVWDTLDQYTFIARIKGDDRVRDAKEILVVHRARLSVSTQTIDSIRKITITLASREKGQWEPAPDVELKAFIDRQFGKIPLGEDSYTTDESGTAELEFNETIPGDREGNIRVGALIEDHEDYGNLTSRSQVAWGLPVRTENGFMDRRTLWSSRNRAPVWLLILANATVIVVWGVIAYLIYTIFEMRKSKEKYLPKT